MAAITIGGVNVVLRPLLLGDVRKFHEDGTLQKVPGRGIGFLAALDRLDATARVVHASVRRDHPEVKVEQVAEALDAVDLLEVEAVLDAVLGGTGLTRVLAAGEADRP